MVPIIFLDRLKLNFVWCLDVLSVWRFGPIYHVLILLFDLVGHTQVFSTIVVFVIRVHVMPLPDYDSPLIHRMQADKTWSVNGPAIMSQVYISTKSEHEDDLKVPDNDGRRR